MDITDAPGTSSLHERLWRTHAVELVRYGALLVGPHDAPDVVSSAFMRVAAKLAAGTIENHRHYLFRAVTNEARDHVRGSTNRRRRDLLAVAAASTSVPESLIDVRRAVAVLSVRQRAVVYLAYWEDLSERSIAEVLDISLGSVRRHLSRAQSHLREALHD